MTKVVLNHDEASGQLTTESGIFIGTYVGKLPRYEGCDKTAVDDLVKLKEAGFTAEEIVMMVKKEVL